MTMERFIKLYKKEIDIKIKSAGSRKIDDDERIMWVENDYDLYTLAESENVYDLNGEHQ